MCEVYVFGADRQQRMLASAANVDVGLNSGYGTYNVDTRLMPIREIIVLPPTVAGRSYHRPVVPDDLSALRLYSLPAGIREVVLHTRLTACTHREDVLLRLYKRCDASESRGHT